MSCGSILTERPRRISFISVALFADPPLLAFFDSSYLYLP